MRTQAYLGSLLFVCLLFMLKPGNSCLAEQMPINARTIGSQNLYVWSPDPHREVYGRIVDGHLVLTTTNRGLLTTTSIGYYEGDAYHNLFTRLGYYYVIGGDDCIIVTKWRTNWKLFEGCTLYKLGFDGKLSLLREYEKLPVYLFIGGKLLYSVHSDSETCRIEQWNDSEQTFQLIADDVLSTSMKAFPSLLLLSRPTADMPFYHIWIPAADKMVDIPETDRQVDNFIYADGIIYWSANEGIYQYDIATQSTEALQLFANKSTLYFCLDGEELYFIENNTLCSFNLTTRVVTDRQITSTGLKNNFVVLNGELYSFDAQANVVHNVLKQ